MRMHNEEGSDVRKPDSNGEPMDTGSQELPCPSMGQRYRELKSKLKYLIYEHTCFESELYKAQSRLVELAQDKTVLLDQLLQYEPISDEEEEVTDYSSDEDAASESKPYRALPSKQLMDGPSRGFKSSEFPSSSTQSPATDSPKSSNLTRQGIAKAAAIINSVSNNITSKVSSKIGSKRQAKHSNKAGSGSAIKILKTVSRVRQNPPVQEDTPTSPSSNTSKQKLVVSYPISVTSIASEVPPSTTSLVISSTASSSLTSLSTVATKSENRSIAPVTTVVAKPPPLLVSSKGSVQQSPAAAAAAAAAASLASVPPLIPDGTKGHRASSSTSSSSSSSSSGESGDSGSECSSSSDDEAMDNADSNTGNTGPVQMVSSVKSSSDLPRPKAILSPVKLTPPLLVRGSVPTPPPTISPRQGQSAFSSWSQSPVATRGEVGGSPSAADSAVGFVPIAPPLSSPSSSLPFSSLNKPGTNTASAFQVFSPKQASAAPVSSPHTSSTQQTTSTDKNSSTNNTKPAGPTSDAHS